MPIVMDKILTEYADQAFEAAHLGRNGVHTTCDASGDAMRFVDAKGRIAWKATPNPCQHLKDLELDAHEDLEDI
jgi:hypothetical protein